MSFPEFLDKNVYTLYVFAYLMLRLVVNAYLDRHCGIVTETATTRTMTDATGATVTTVKTETETGPEPE
jgi:hypothetical protein